MSHAPGRVVVTGGAGFLGSWLSESLLERGSRVVGVDNFVTGAREAVDRLAEHAAYEFVEADVGLLQAGQVSPGAVRHRVPARGG